MFYLLMVALGLMITDPSQGQQKKMMPVATGSEKAVQLYNEATTAWEDGYISRFVDLLVKSSAEEPGFFMGNYTLAIYYLNNEEKFLEFAGNAINGKAQLNKSELLLKEALVRLMADRKADVTGIGKKLVEMYPADDEAYSHLATFQALAKDYKSAAETLKKAIELAKRPSPYYNAIGYYYMYLQQFGDAEAAFDKYIELDSKLPNPYDSKAEYYLTIKDYQKSYEYYLKAHEVDPTWSLNLAMYVKAIIDSPLKDEESKQEIQTIWKVVLDEIAVSFKREYEPWTVYFAHEPYILWLQGQKNSYTLKRGWDEVNSTRKAMLEQLNASGKKYKYVLNGTDDYITRLYKDAALVSFTSKITVEIDGVKYEVAGREVRSLEKQDGKWKIVYLGTIYTSTWEEEK